MLSFLSSATLQSQLTPFKFDLHKLVKLWDMPDQALEVVESIYQYEHEQARGQAQAQSTEEKFKYLRAWPLEKNTGIFLYLLVRYLRPKIILECGTSFGASGIFSASALKQNQYGNLVTVEVSKLKHEAAWKNFQQAAVEGYISQEKVAFDQYLKTTDELFDLVFLDCDRSRYPVYFETLQSKLNANSIILADNALDKAPDIFPLQLKLDEYLWQHTVLPIGDGLLIAHNPHYGIMCRDG